MVKRQIFQGGARLIVEGGAEYRLVPVPDAPCRVACPAGVNVKGYVGLIAAGKFDRALEVVRRSNPLPGICGRVCTHPCEAECRRGAIDEPVAIRALKRFIADYALNAPRPVLPPETVKRSERVAVVGAGPAGLTAANDLVRLGYRVTVFEAEKRPGGMLVWGIPPFRLPRAVIEQEIESIFALGVELVTCTRINDPAALLQQGYAAVFYAPGCPQSIRLGLPLEDRLTGVVDALTFLKRAFSGELTGLTGRVLVIGGGNSALDAARVARRMGAEVWILYRRTRSEMPAGAEEVSEAEAEGVRIEYLTQPVELVHKDGRLTGVRCVRNTLGAPDASGRRRPVAIPGSEFLLEAQWVITALGQRPEREVVAPPAGVFVGGDAAGGPATVIDAIASGHRGARAIHRFLTGATDGLPEVRTEVETQGEVLVALPRARVRPPRLPVDARTGFCEVEARLSPEQAVAEAERCLRCGPCAECVRCHHTCPRHQVAVYLSDSSEIFYIRVHALPDAAESPARLVLPTAEEISAFLRPLLVNIDPVLCRGCGLCVEVCPHQALELADVRAGVLVARVAPERCRGCGNCLVVCPSGALRGWVEREGASGKNGRIGVGTRF